MPDTPEPKAEKVALEKRIAELEKTVKALLVAQKDIINFNGREHMPEGTYLGMEF